MQKARAFHQKPNSVYGEVYTREMWGLNNTREKTYPLLESKNLGKVSHQPRVL